MTDKDHRKFNKVQINVPEKAEDTLIRASELFTKSLPIESVYRNPKSASSSKYATNCEDVMLTFKAFEPEDHTLNPDKHIIFPAKKTPAFGTEDSVLHAVQGNILDTLLPLLDPEPIISSQWPTLTGLRPDISFMDSESKVRLYIEGKKWNAFMTWNPNDDKTHDGSEDESDDETHDGSVDETEALKKSLEDCSDPTYEITGSDSPMQLSQILPTVEKAEYRPAIRNFWHGMQQLVMYMMECNRQTMYGMLTSYVHSYFAILRRDKNGNTVTVSRAVMYNDTNVMKHMFTFVKLALETPVVSGGFERRAVIPYDVQSSDRPVFVVTGQLGEGRSGTVLAVKDNSGSVFAVKVLPEQTKSKDYQEICKHMRQEASAYEQLTDLQGKVVPKFHRHGSFDRKRPCLILEAFDGDPIQPKQLKQHQKTAVVNALEKIHSKGILHGDIRCQNILVAKDTDEIRFVDFGYSKKSKAPDAFKKEMKELKSLLQSSKKRSKKAKLDPLVQAGT